MEELYDNLYAANFTVISNEFLDKYLADTKPEYLKVFLFYLWKGIKENYSIEEASTELDLDYTIVEMAIKFWVKKKLMKKEILSNNKEKTNNVDVKNIISIKDKENELVEKRKKEYSNLEKNLLFVAEKLFGKSLSDRQVNLISKCYTEYGFNEDLIEYLLEYCANKSKTTVMYMSAIASSWYEQDIKNVEDAKSFVNSLNKSKVISKNSSKIKGIVRNDDYDKMFYEKMSKGKF